MCGRFANSETILITAKRWMAAIGGDVEWTPSDDIRPTQRVPVLLEGPAEVPAIDQHPVRSFGKAIAISSQDDRRGPSSRQRDRYDLSTSDGAGRDRRRLTGSKQDAQQSQAAQAHHDFRFRHRRWQRSRMPA
jgi:hypothetical protein